MTGGEVPPDQFDAPALVPQAAAAVTHLTEGGVEIERRREVVPGQDPEQLAGGFAPNRLGKGFRSEAEEPGLGQVVAGRVDQDVPGRVGIGHEEGAEAEPERTVTVRGLLLPPPQLRPQTLPVQKHGRPPI